MAKWELNKFRIEKVDNTLIFETEISVIEFRKNFTITVMYNYGDKKVTVKGNVNLKQDYTLYEIIIELERLLDNPLIKELAEHSRKSVERVGFELTRLENYQEGILANLRYIFNNKYLEFGSILIYPAFKDSKKLCEVDLEVETNTASNVKTLYDLLTTICISSVRIFVDINRINKILNTILQKLQILYTQSIVL
jgi:hypothetical protein